MLLLKKMLGLLLGMGCVLTGLPSVQANDPTEAQLEFFEKQVRPILVTRCLECHSGKLKEPKGGLRVDSLTALLKGGDTSPAVVPGKPAESLLVSAINYGDLYQMPPKSKLPAEEIATLTKWVEQGAAWPNEAPTTTAGSDEKHFDLAARQAAHWCWQPMGNPLPPKVTHTAAIRQPLDRFLVAALEAQGLAPAPQADRRTLIRRAYFDLIGLPPKPAEIDAFLADPSPQAFEKVVDGLLASPHFGERWGRHWLDLVRYAESRGHEFDYNVSNSHQYRDYVIQSLNADLPYNQFVIEQIAGDLLPQPRLDASGKVNQSILGTGFWFLGEWVHSPVDIRKDETDRFDNMLDVFSKTFLGLTVACARCHDHKFDAISQQDYYALGGYLQSSSYRLARFETMEPHRAAAEQLAAVEAKYRAEIGPLLAQGLRAQVTELAASLAQDETAAKLQTAQVPAASWEKAKLIIDYAQAATYAGLQDGWTFGSRPTAAGTLLLTPTAKDSKTLPQLAPYGAARRDSVWNNLALSPGSENDTGRISSWTRAGRTLKTPTFTLDRGGMTYYLVKGSGHVLASVDSHIVIHGPLHGQIAMDTGGDGNSPVRWIAQDLRAYLGHNLHVEFIPREKEDFQVLAVIEAESRPAEPAQAANVFFSELRESDTAAAEGAKLTPYTQAIEAIARELAATGSLAEPSSASRAALANWLLTQVASSDKVTPGLLTKIQLLLEQHQQARAAIIQSQRMDSHLAMTMWDGTSHDEQLLIRGNVKTPGPIVPRRFLTALGDSATPGPSAKQVSALAVSDSPHSASGRLELAQKVVDPASPLAARVLVNRLWQHLLGRGIVPSVDNFGVLGQLPSNPDLLDHLASEFVRDGWSVKRAIRSIMLSGTYQQASSPENAALAAGSPENTKTALAAAFAKATAADPTNILLWRANIRRLEGEAIRDSLLALSGRLDPQQFGPSVPLHLSPFLQGRGRPADGPLDGNGRRSIYISIRRNFLDPMMLAFDSPSPASTMGRRNVSNVPAQALILMNDPFVLEQAKRWGTKLLAKMPQQTLDERVGRLYVEAFGRSPSPDEIKMAAEFFVQQAAEYKIPAEATANDPRLWTDFCHVLINAKEFIFVY